MSNNEAIGKLAEILSKPSSRKSFATDPEGTLQDRGVKPEDLPKEIYEVLSDLEGTQLGAINRLKMAFDKSPDVSDDLKLQMV
jgi:hypothetical protein